MDRVTRYCTSCGHQLGIGRYCTNCGARVRADAADSPAPEGDHATMVRAGALRTVTAAPPPPPPPAGPPPSSARYPLYADAVASPTAAGPVPTAPTASDGARSRSLLPWLAALLVLAVVAVAGGLLLLGSSEGDSERSGPGAARGERAASPGDGPDGGLEPAAVVVPDTAPASVDDAGTRVTFEAANMLDADPRTCWRMAGDATGAAVVLRFDEPVTVTGVGLVNGYAKTDRPHDWYAGNRRIERVAWVLDDATEVRQELDQVRDLQTVDVDGVETTSIELRILEVSEPGTGPDRRDFTAISDVEITGR